MLAQATWPDTRITAQPKTVGNYIIGLRSSRPPDGNGERLMLNATFGGVLLRLQNGPRPTAVALIHIIYRQGWALCSSNCART